MKKSMEEHKKEDRKFYIAMSILCLLGLFCMFLMIYIVFFLTDTEEEEKGIAFVIKKEAYTCHEEDTSVGYGLDYSGDFGLVINSEKGKEYKKYFFVLAIVKMDEEIIKREYVDEETYNKYVVGQRYY